MGDVQKKRQLPMIKDLPPAPPASAADEPDAVDERPPWHWVGFGTVAIFGAWLPLSLLAQAARVRIVASRLGDLGSPEASGAAIAALPDAERVRLTILLLAPHVIALAAAAVAGGYLVGRWGGAGVSVREAALAGLAAALIASVLAWGGLSWAPLLPIALASLAAAFGGFWGLRKRPR